MRMGGFLSLNTNSCTLPIIMELSSSKKWRSAVLEFIDRLVRVVVLPSPDDEVYESNVLVVLKEIRPEDFEFVSKIASEVGERVNPLLAGEEERVRWIYSLPVEVEILVSKLDKAEKLLEEAEADIRIGSYNKAISASYFSVRLTVKHYLRDLKTTKDNKIANALKRSLVKELGEGSRENRAD